jgi:hypothetical protein
MKPPALDTEKGIGGWKLPSPFPSSVENPAPPLAIARSRKPSRLKSATTTDAATGPAGKFLVATKDTPCAWTRLANPRIGNAIAATRKIVRRCASATFCVAET